jgi:hypothetical protein
LKTINIGDRHIDHVSLCSLRDGKLLLNAIMVGAPTDAKSLVFDTNEVDQALCEFFRLHLVYKTQCHPETLELSKLRQRYINDLDSCDYEENSIAT